eukprot:1165775-Alexandrium_andersonii.AAC.1
MQARVHANVFQRKTDGTRTTNVCAISSEGSTALFTCVCAFHVQRTPEWMQRGSLRARDKLTG